MKANWLGFLPASLVGAFGLLVAGQSVDLTGNWYLDIDKSTWGAARKPLSVFVAIQHNEPLLHYTGSVTYTNEDTREFSFNGAIDGKPYPMVRSYGVGTVVLRRVDDGTVESVFRTDDGTWIENARTTVSADGKTMTRKLRLQSPDGTKSWTEVYARR